MFLAVLLTVCRTREQPKCPSTDEWIKMWCIYTTEYESAIKKKEIRLFAATWMDLSEVSQTERQTSHGITYVWNFKNDTNELDYKSEIDLLIQKAKPRLPKGKGAGRDKSGVWH